MQLAVALVELLVAAVVVAAVQHVQAAQAVQVVPLVIPHVKQDVIIIVLHVLDVR